MLYLSTRNKTDSFTAFRAMHNDHTPDGGLYVPFRLTAFSSEELVQIKSMTFGDAVAKILNLLFSQQLTGWDIDFCIGRAPVKVEQIGHKAIVAEMWHNHDGAYKTTREIVFHRIFGTPQAPSEWACIAIDIAFLFGIYTQLPDADVFDVSLCEDEVSAITAAWYAKNMGLPVGRILLTCGEMSPVWNFVLNGQLNTTALKRLGDNFVGMAERMIYDTYQFDTAQDFVAACVENASYNIDEENRSMLTDRLHAVVVGADRAENVVQSTVRTNGYTLSTDAAGAFGGLQDYRSKGGESRLTLLLSCVKPTN